MSTFSGFLDEIENVSIDRFTPLNFRSKAFFLSHCHMDHMIGLNEITAENQLPGPLYLSEVSQIIIKRRYPAIKHLIPLKLGGEREILSKGASRDMIINGFFINFRNDADCPV